MVKVAILDDYQRIALEMADWSVLPTGTDVRVFDYHVADEDALAEQLKDFQIIVAMRERTPFGRSLFNRLPNLRLLVTTGYRNDAIDLDAARDHDVTVCGTGGFIDHTAELTWGLILGLVRHIPEEDAATRQGGWQRTVGVALHGKVLGVLGLGNLGSRMARIGRAFGMSVIAWSQNLADERAAECGATLVTKDDLFARSDVLTIHLRLSDRTRGLVGAKELKLMKQTAFLINTSRGPIVEETALVEALESNAIAGAGLDVFDREPLPSDHPLLQTRNTVLTPHIGYVTAEAYRLYYQESVEDILAFLRGQPIRVLDPS